VPSTPKIVLAVASVLLAAPLMVAARALPAAAATGKLLVTTLDRSGHSVVSSITVSTDIHSIGGLPTWTNSGTAVSIADGTYAVLADIEQTVNGTGVGTIAEATVTVSGTGTTRLTLDARKGVLIRATLDGKPLSDYVDARVCVGSSPAQMEVFENSGNLYVVPSASSLYRFAYLAQGQGAVVTAQTSSGIPASPGGAWKSTQLAKVTLTVRSNEQPAYDTAAEVQPENSDGSATCGTDLSSQLFNNPAPYIYSTRVSAGYWVVRTDDFGSIGAANADIGGYFIKKNMLAGHSYSVGGYAAAWAPTGMFTMIWRHSVDLNAPTFADPYHNGNDAETMNVLALSLAGRTVATGKMTDFGDFNPAINAAGWYTLTDTATRYDPGLSFPATILSPKVTFAWRFYASPSWSQEAAGYWTSFEPAGLGYGNNARPGGTTTVFVAPYRDSSNANVPVPSESVTGLKVWASSDGAHWTSVAVHHGSGGWYVTVTNPATGFVSLRATVTGSRGDSSTETVYRAYGIS
jgi:hypothetical protein